MANWSIYEVLFFRHERYVSPGRTKKVFVFRTPSRRKCYDLSAAARKRFFDNLRRIFFRELKLRVFCDIYYFRVVGEKKRESNLLLDWSIFYSPTNKHTQKDSFRLFIILFSFTSEVRNGENVR